MSNVVYLPTSARPPVQNNAQASVETQRAFHVAQAVRIRAAGLTAEPGAIAAAVRIALRMLAQGHSASRALRAPINALRRSAQTEPAA